MEQTIEKENKKTGEKRPGVFTTIRQLSPNIKGYKGKMVGAWISVAVEVLCEVIIPFLMQPMIDTVSKIAGQEVQSSNFVYNMLSGLTDIQRIWTLAGIMVGFALLSCAAGVAGGFFASDASAGFGRNLRKGMYYKIQDFSFQNIDKFSISSLVTRMTTDITNVQFALQMVLRMIVRGPMMLIMAWIMASITCIRLSWIFLVVIPFMATGLIAIALITHPTFERVFNAFDDLNENVKENLEGIRVVKSFNREDFENQKFGKISYFIYKNFAKAEKLLALNNPIVMISVNLSILLISWLGGLLVVNTAGSSSPFSVGELSSFFTYTMQILMSLNMMSMGFVMVIISRNSAERINEVLYEKPTLVSPENALTDVRDGSIEFDHVSFRYSASGNKDVLHDINLKVPSGSSLGIIGATGSSKSTLVSMIPRLYDVSSGSVKVGGEDVRKYDLVTLRDSVAMVLQKNTLFTGTIASNLRWGNENASDADLKKACDIAQASEFIEGFPQGYNTPIDEGGTNVSGGQKQRLCIARALLKRPKILILDDSTSAVDTHTDALIREGFRKELPEMTRVIIAQRLLSIKDCDQIAIIDDGKIVALGTNDELMQTSPIYQELYKTQLGGGGDFDVQ